MEGGCDVTRWVVTSPAHRCGGNSVFISGRSVSSCPTTLMWTGLIISNWISSSSSFCCCCCCCWKLLLCVDISGVYVRVCACVCAEIRNLIIDLVAIDMLEAEVAQWGGLSVAHLRCVNFQLVQWSSGARCRIYYWNSQLNRYLNYLNRFKLMRRLAVDSTAANNR